MGSTKVLYFSCFLYRNMLGIGQLRHMRPGGTPRRVFSFRQSQDRGGEMWRARHIFEKRTQAGSEMEP